MEPTLPFLLQTPSLYTTSHSFSSGGGERFLAVETTIEGSQLLVDSDAVSVTVDASAFETSGGGTPRAKNLASTRVLNFLNLAFGNPLTCSSQSDLQVNHLIGLVFILSDR
jgi:hypothetical protein